MQNDHDPSKLVAETPCKLLRYLVADDSHVDADTPYAEVEVMKMCMPLLSPASGIIHFKMSEGQAMQVYSILFHIGSTGVHIERDNKIVSLFVGW